MEADKQKFRDAVTSLGHLICGAIPSALRMSQMAREATLER